jgi:hypothetical protein
MANELLPELNYEQCAQALAAGIRSQVTTAIIGSPGLGKTACVRDASHAIDRPCYDLVASNMDPTDVAGLPYRDAEGHVARELFPEIRAVCEHAATLFIDEATTMPKSVEGPMMRVALERNAGGTPLHEKTSVVMAFNKPEECPGGIDLTAAMVNRIILLRYEPSFTELAKYFNGEPVKAQPNVLNEDAYQKQLALEKADFAATVAYDPTLFVMKPPPGSIDQAEPWGSPRAWETGLRAYAALGLDLTAGVTQSNQRIDIHEGMEVGFALLAGAVGPQPAAQYLAIRDLRKHLPSINQITAKPKEAPVPTQVDRQIAALGVLARVADMDAWAAWTYAARLKPEIAAACARMLMNKPIQNTPNAEEGKLAQVKLLATITKRMR